MSSGGQGIPRPYSAIIPVELLLAVAVPVGAVLLSDVYWVPLAIFVMTSVPAGVALYLHGFLPVPRSSILIGGLRLHRRRTVIDAHGDRRIALPGSPACSGRHCLFCISCSFFRLFRFFKRMTRSLFF